MFKKISSLKTQKYQYFQIADKECIFKNAQFYEPNVIKTTKLNGPLIK